MGLMGSKAIDGKLKLVANEADAPGGGGGRFLTMQAVADELATSLSQIYHMVRSGELPAIKIGGRGQWRIERSKLEEYIAQKYAETADFVRSNPLVDHAEP
jgi:excisionase family DNA binding protein